MKRERGMYCPRCGSRNTVIRSTHIERERVTRRHECRNCLQRFTAYERAAEEPVETVGPLLRARINRVESELA